MSDYKFYDSKISKNISTQYTMYLDNNNYLSNCNKVLSPVINNTLKVLQTVVLSLDEQYVTNLRFTAPENTLRAILNVCFKIV